MELDASVKFPADTSAKILTSGLLGDQYIGLEPGGSDKNLGAGEPDPHDPIRGRAGKSDRPVPL